MTLSDASRAREIDQALLAGDYLRRSPFNVGGTGFHKEWLHFVVHADDVELLVNLSVVDDTRAEGMPGLEVPRLVVLARTREGWDGDIESFELEDATIVGGEVGLRFGSNDVSYASGRYRITVRCRHRPIEIDMVIEAESMPALSTNIRLELGDRPINWMVLPRATATGNARIAGVDYGFDRVPAYHDHNWGHFAWGRDFAWEWGFSLPESRDCPWSVVFVRLCDHAQTMAYMQGLFLWKDTTPWRIFRSHEMQVDLDGFLRAPSPFKLPRVMSVVSPGLATDVPERLYASARADGDELELEFSGDDVAQVCIPNDTDTLGLTLINEVGGDLELHGRIRGEEVEMSGRSMFEFVRHG